MARPGSSPYKVALYCMTGFIITLYALYSSLVHDQIRHTLSLTIFITLSMGLVSIFINKTNGNDFFLSAHICFLFGFYIFIVIGMLKNVYIYDMPVTDDIYIINLSCAYIIIALGVYLFSYHLISFLRMNSLSEFDGTSSTTVLDASITPRTEGSPLHRFPLHNSPPPSKYQLFNRKSLQVLICMTGFIGFLWFFTFNYISKSNTQQEASTLQRFGVYFTIISGILAFLYYKCSSFFEDKAPVPVFIKFLLVFSISTVFFRGSRYIYIYLFSFLFFYSLYEHIYIKLMQIKMLQYFYIIISIVCIFIFANITKTFAVANWDLSSLSYEEFILLSKERLFSFEFVDAFDNLTVIINAYERTGDYIYGKSLLVPFVNFIPRSIFPDKPIAFGSMLVDKEFGGVEGLSLAPSLIGELTANFGLLGVVTGFCLFGFIAYYIDFFFYINRNKPAHQLVHIPLIYLMLMQNRGDFLLNTGLFYIIFPLIISKAYISKYE